VGFVKKSGDEDAVALGIDRHFGGGRFQGVLVGRF
jgi:hypothetical protein